MDAALPTRKTLFCFVHILFMYVININVNVNVNININVNIAVKGAQIVTWRKLQFVCNSL